MAVSFFRGWRVAEVTMPRLSDTMTEGTIAKWLKQPGDQVKKGDILLEIETDKATMELEAYEAGVVEKVLVNEGQTVPIGQPIMLIGDGSGAAQPSGDGQPSGGDGTQAEAAAPEAPGAPAEGSGTGAAGSATQGATAPGQDTTGARPAEAGEGDTQASTDAPKRSEQAPAEPQRSYGYGHPTAETALAPGGSAPTQAAPQQAAPAQTAPQPQANGEVRASPMARAVARELGVNLAAVHGSGPGGRVIRADVEQAAKGGTAPQPAPAAQPAPSQQPSAAPASAPAPAPAQAGVDQEVEEIPLTNIRRITGQRMVESLQSAPHFFLTALIDVTDLLALRQQINGQLGDSERRISVNDLIVKACALTLRAVPEANSSFAGDKILRKKRIHVGIAVPTERGLTVPVIKDTDQKSVGQIARESHALIEKARAGRLTPADFTGGTFSVSNLGMFGIEHFTAVINTPEAAILAVGAAMKEPVVVDGEVVIRDRMRVTLSVDHRALDGADGARYLQELKKLLESPLKLLTL
jgi:pyruvate dehydrogenase E2 component (dihydrolipoamide acetyltransferase)